MWNYNFTIPAIFIYTIFLVYFITGSALPVKRNRGFLMLVVSHGLTSFFDIISSFLDNNYSQFDQRLLVGTNLLFFVFFTATAFLFVNYVLSVPEQASSLIRISLFNRIFFVIFEVVIILSIFTQWVFYVDEAGYHRGIYYNIIYFIFFSCILEMYILFVLYRGVFTRREFTSGMLFVSILLMGLILRYKFPTLLIMNTFCLGAILVIFLSFQDIHLFEDQRVGLFNNRAFLQYVMEHLSSGKLFLYGYGIINYDELRRMFGGAQMDKELQDITKQLRKEYPYQVLFYLRNGRFMVAWNRPFEFKEIRNRMVAIGTVEFPEDLQIDDAGQLIEVARDVFSKLTAEAADKHIVVDHDHIVELNRNVRVQQSLNNALHNDGIQIYLQPIYSVDKKRITGAEALARIEDPDLGTVQPNDFIPIAEKNGLIVKVGEAVFRKTCAFLRDSGDDRLQWINVNLSPIQCVAEEPVASLLDISDEYGVSGEKLKLEITEDAMVDDEELKRMMLKMSDHGFCFELDDFGVGFSNVLRLSNFPFTAVKIDRELVWQYHDNPTNSVLPHLIEDIRSSGMDVVAEGIESKSMGKEMIELGCNYLQGFYFSRPVPLKRFPKVFDLQWDEFSSL